MVRLELKDLQGAREMKAQPGQRARPEPMERPEQQVQLELMEQPEPRVQLEPMERPEPPDLLELQAQPGEEQEKQCSSLLHRVLLR